MPLFEAKKVTFHAFLMCFPMKEFDAVFVSSSESASSRNGLKFAYFAPVIKLLTSARVLRDGLSRKMIFKALNSLCGKEKWRRYHLMQFFPAFYLLFGELFVPLHPYYN